MFTITHEDRLTRHLNRKTTSFETPSHMHRWGRTYVNHTCFTFPGRADWLIQYASRVQLTLAYASGAELLLSFTATFCPRPLGFWSVRWDDMAAPRRGCGTEGPFGPCLEFAYTRALCLAWRVHLDANALLRANLALHTIPMIVSVLFGRPLLSVRKTSAYRVPPPVMLDLK